VLKLASLKQQPLLFATNLPISSRKKKEAGPSGRSATPSLGGGVEWIAVALLGLSLRDVFLFRSAWPLFIGFAFVSLLISRVVEWAAFASLACHFVTVLFV